MSNKHMYIDFHVLQTVPPSCVNRDDMGSPKTAVYGGAIRARISSQAQKHAMRLMFSEIFDAGQCGLRTKRIVKLVADKLIAAKGLSEEKATSLAMDLFTNAVTKEGKKMKMKNADVGMDALFFLIFKKRLFDFALGTRVVPEGDDHAMVAVGLGTHA